jgi:hypothetical protein
VSNLNLEKNKHPHQIEDGADTYLDALKMAAETEVGLVFISVVNGRLKIDQLSIMAMPQRFVADDGETRFTLTVPTPFWTTTPQKQEVLGFPTMTIIPTLQMKSVLVSAPNQIKDWLLYYENLYRGSVGQPYTILKITPEIVRPNAHKTSKAESKELLYGIHIDYSERGACPSWEETELPAPSPSL